MASYVLSPAQYRQIKKTVLDTMLPTLVGRRLLPVDPDIGAGAQEATRTKLDKGTEEARIIPKAGRYGVITPTEQEVTVYIRKIGQAFVVTDEDLESSRVTGRPLDKRSIQLCSRAIQEKEDAFIFNGYDKVPDELGLVGNAAQTAACDEKWSTDDGEPYEDCNNIVGKIEDYDFTPKFAVFNNQDFKYLRKEDITGEIYLDKIVRNLGIPVANILKTSAMTKGTALFCDSGNTVAELKQVESIFIKPPLEQANDTQLIRVRERLGMDVYEPYAFATLTNIS